MQVRGCATGQVGRAQVPFSPSAEFREMQRYSEVVRRDAALRVLDAAALVRQANGHLAL